MTLDDLARQAQFAVEGLLDCALTAVRERVSENGKLSAALIEAEQHAAHGLAWLATYVEAIKEMAAYAARMREEGRFGKTEELLDPGGPRRISRADFRRHPDEPGRNRAPRRLRPRPGRDRAVPHRSHRDADRLRQHPRKPRRPRRADRRSARRRDRRSRPRRDLRGHSRRDAPLRRRRGRAARARLASRQRLYPARGHRRACRKWACSASPSPRLMAAWGSARWRCASCRRSCRAAISASARSAPARRSPPNSSWSAAPRRRSRNTCRRSPAAKSCRPPSSPSPTPAPTSRACARARCARATNTWSAAPRPGSPIRSAPT